MGKKFFPIPKRPQVKARRVGKGNDNNCGVTDAKKGHLAALPKQDGLQNNMSDRSKPPGINKPVATATVTSPFQSCLVSINQNCKSEPKWSYSLMWTEQGAVLKMIPKEPLLQAHSEKSPEYLPELPSPVFHAHSSTEVGVNRSQEIAVSSFGSEVRRNLIPKPNHPQKQEDAERFVVLPLNFGSPGSRNMLSAESNSDEKIIALITIEKEFLKDICTGKYKSEFVTCDLALPPANVKNAAANQVLNGKNAYPDLGESDLRYSASVSESAFRKSKRCTNPSEIAEDIDPSKKRKREFNEVNKVELVKLPCCTDLPLEMTCSNNLPQKSTAAPGVSTEVDAQFAQLQQFIRCQIDEFDEIQHQLEAICFAKPEILTSSATLTSLNSNNFPPIDDLLRRYEANAWDSSKQVKNSIRVVDNNKDGLRRKSTKKPLHNNYIPRGPLPFEKSLHLPAAVHEKNVKRKLLCTSNQVPDVTSLRRQSPVGFSRLPSLKRQLLEEIQPPAKAETQSNFVCPNALTTSNNTNRKVTSHQPKASLPKPKPKHPKKNELPNFCPDVNPCGFKSNTVSLKPKRKSPFDWLDTYFTPNPKR